VQVSNSASSEAAKAVLRRKDTCSQAGHARSVEISERAPSCTARVAVVGTGFVGATTAYGLLLSDRRHRPRHPADLGSGWRTGPEGFGGDRQAAYWWHCPL